MKPGYRAAGLGLMLAFGLSAHAGNNRCTQTCEVQRDDCLKQLGSAASQNCRDGGKICRDRCNPSRLGLGQRGHDDDDASLRVAKPRLASDRALVCQQNCDLGRHTCAEAGNGDDQCRLAQKSCIKRCRRPR